LVYLGAQFGVGEQGCASFENRVKRFESLKV
jgi:hypothetical protein